MTEKPFTLESRFTAGEKKLIENAARIAGVEPGRFVSNVATAAARSIIAAQ